MKNKLLLSSALLGSLVIGSFAQAQTTITGGLIVASKNQSDMATQAGSTRSMGRESQINIQNKGKLNNGMDYAAGFALEFDGGQATDPSNENVYIDIISGDTTLTFGVDHIQNTNRTRGVLVGNDAQDLHNGSGYGASAFIQAAGSDPAQSMGAGIVQKTPVGSFSALYVPTAGNAGLNDLVTQSGATAQAAAGAQQLQGTGESAYEIGFTGSLGVAGLNTYAFEGKKERGDTAATGLNGKKPQQKNFGISYNTGPITVGYEYTKHVGFNAALGFADANEIKEHGYGIAYAVNKELSLQLHHTTAKQSEGTAANVTSTGEKAKVTSIQAGYNLGPVALIVGAGKYEGIAGGEDEDGKTIFTRLLTAF